MLKRIELIFVVTVQLWNIFTDKYVHTNVAETSKVDKCMVKVSNLDYGADLVTIKNILAKTTIKVITVLSAQ